MTYAAQAARRRTPLGGGAGAACAAGMAAGFPQLLPTPIARVLYCACAQYSRVDCYPYIKILPALTQPS